MPHNKFPDLLKYIEKTFPQSYPTIVAKDLINENLFSPFTYDLQTKVLNQVVEFVEAVYRAKEDKDYQNSLPQMEIFAKAPTNPSILTCFDFHYSEDMGLKLIEINTNASLYMPIVLLGCSQASQCVDPTFEDLLQSFRQAFELKDGDPVDVLDFIPENEGLYFEFLLYKEWLIRNGHPSRILSVEDYNKLDDVKNVYNRYNDFYFREEISKKHRKDYLTEKVRFSPNPREYFLVADKLRFKNLREYFDKKEMSHFQNMIPETLPVMDFSSKEELWAKRKKYFFKPTTSYGSKGVFNGKGISKKAFEGVYKPGYIAQETAPAGKRTFTYEGQEMEMKVDLRFFTFNGRVQNYGARLYQGQATNIRTPLGGIAPIRIVD